MDLRRLTIGHYRAITPLLVAGTCPQLAQKTFFFLRSYNVILNINFQYA